MAERFPVEEDVVGSKPIRHPCRGGRLSAFFVLCYLHHRWDVVGSPPVGMLREDPSGTQEEPPHVEALLFCSCSWI